MSSAIDLYTTLEWGYYLDVPATRGRARALLVQRHAQRDRRLRLRSNRRCTSALDGQQELHMASKSCTWPARAAHGQQELHMASKSCTLPARAAHCQQELHMASKSCTWPARAAHGRLPRCRFLPLRIRTAARIQGAAHLLRGLHIRGEVLRDFTGGDLHRAGERLQPLVLRPHHLKHTAAHHCAHVRRAVVPAAQRDLPQSNRLGPVDSQTPLNPLSELLSRFKRAHRCRPARSTRAPHAREREPNSAEKEIWGRARTAAAGAPARCPLGRARCRRAWRYTSLREGRQAAQRGETERRRLVPSRLLLCAIGATGVTLYQFPQRFSSTCRTTAGRCTAMQKLRIVTVRVSGGRSLTGPLRDARQFPSTRWYPVPRATRTTLGFGIRPSFKDHSLSRRIKPYTVALRFATVALLKGGGGARTGAEGAAAFEGDLQLLALAAERRHEQRAREAAAQRGARRGRRPVAEHAVRHQPRAHAHAHHALAVHRDGAHERVPRCCCRLPAVTRPTHDAASVCGAKNSSRETPSLTFNAWCAIAVSAVLERVVASGVLLG
jgi:hypothetical protein